MGNGGGGLGGGGMPGSLFILKDQDERLLWFLSASFDVNDQSNLDDYLHCSDTDDTEYIIDMSGATMRQNSKQEETEQSFVK